MLIMAITVLLSNTIDEFTISKKDVISDLSHLGIELKDDFKIIHNTVSGMPERIQETEIEISPKDKVRLITKIKDMNGSPLSYNEQVPIDTNTLNSSEPTFYLRETSMKIDNIYTQFFFSISEENNIIRYQRIEL